MKSPRWFIVVGTAALLVYSAPAFARAQEPAPPAPQAPPASQVAAPVKSQKEKYSHANDFLILGTVFDPKGYAFAGVELRIRRSKEKKYRWDSYTNSRGEFAVRVPQGSDYEMVIHAKGFQDQTRALGAKTGVSEARIVFHMESAEGAKK
jgi:Carboxypeptidase regulatory-like domain